MLHKDFHQRIIMSVFWAILQVEKVSSQTGELVPQDRIMITEGSESHSSLGNSRNHKVRTKYSVGLILNYEVFKIKRTLTNNFTFCPGFHKKPVNPEYLHDETPKAVANSVFSVF